MRVFFICLMAAYLSGCADYHELDERGVVKNLTVEELGGGCAVTAALAGDGGVLTGLGSTVADGAAALAESLGSPVFFEQVTVVAIHSGSAHRIDEIADWALSGGGPPLDVRLFIFDGGYRGPLDFERAEKLIGENGGLVSVVADGQSPPVITLTRDGGMQIAGQ